MGIFSFLTPPLPHNVVFVSSLAVHTNICFVRVTSHIPKPQQRTAAKGNKPGPDPEIQPRLARIKPGIVFHMF